MKYKRLAGIILLLIDCFLVYYRRDIIVEMFNGRPLAQLEIYKLLLPVIVLVMAIFFITKKDKNEKAAGNP